MRMVGANPFLYRGNELPCRSQNLGGLTRGHDVRGFIAQLVPPAAAQLEVINAVLVGGAQYQAESFERRSVRSRERFHR